MATAAFLLKYRAGTGRELKGTLEVISTRGFQNMAIHAAGDGDEPRSTIKFLCSYGGRILPRKPYGKLCYSGGFTRILSVHPSISYPELMARLAEFCGFSVVLRCQLPSCDLETLVTVKSDEDLANLVEEYRKESPRSPQKIKAVLSTTAGSPKVLPPPPPSSSSSSPASSADSSGCNSPMHEASDGNCVQNRPGRLRCHPCNVEPGAGAVRRMRCLGH